MFTQQKSSNNYGHRLLTAVIDDTARTDPNKVLISIAAGPLVKDGQRNISFGQMANAINRCAWWIEGTLRSKGINFPTIATYLHPTDFRQAILIMGAVKTGYQMFLSSPRNHIEIQVEMLERLDCNIIFSPEEETDTTKGVLQHRGMAKFSLPSLAYFLADDHHKPYPYHKTFDEARNDPFVIMHSSGTTGPPKILTLRHGTEAAQDAYQRFPAMGDCQWAMSAWKGKRVLTNFPWPHRGGICTLSCGIYNDFVGVMPAAWPLSAEDADYMHRTANVQAVWYSPSVLLDIARDSLKVEALSRLDMISYSGGVLPREVGDLIAGFAPLNGIMGSTETGILPCELPPPTLWDHFRFNSRYGAELRHFADDMHELIVHRKGDCEMYQGIFCTLGPGVDTYAMRDLYIENSEHKGWWRSAGRIDDVVVMADAKKVNAVPYENTIEQHPAVASALVCGSGRPRPALLIQARQPLRCVEEERAFVDAVWPQVEKANFSGPVFGGLTKELVVVTKRDKPMARSGGKDTVRRKMTVDLYQREIDEVYRRTGESQMLSCLV